MSFHGRSGDLDLGCPGSQNATLSTTPHTPGFPASEIYAMELLTVFFDFVFIYSSFVYFVFLPLAVL